MMYKKQFNRQEHESDGQIEAGKVEDETNLALSWLFDVCVIPTPY